MNGIKKCFFSLALITIPLVVIAQEDIIDDILNEEVMIDNPIYKPVISVGSGVFNFYGDVKNNFINPVIGDFAYKVNISTFVDPKRFYKANFFFIYGQLSADQRSMTDLDQNLNFQTDIVDFGVNLEYNFDHIFKKRKTLRPFISLGIENIQFTPKGDLMIGKIPELKYQYSMDGTIRDNNGNIIHRDYDFETDLRRSNTEKYSQNTFSIPIDAGLDFKISDRVTCRLGTSLHLTSTDFLDNVKGSDNNDIFTFSYFSLQFDLFSQPKTMIIEKMFAELEIDDVMFDDEDGDFVMDPVDDCPGTPYGIVVDTLGCPLDGDMDGIPDYLDLEPNSAPGVWVDADGRTISEDAHLEKILGRTEAMNRSDVRAYFDTIGKGYVRKVVTVIPDKYKKVDTNKDGYISFEELLKAIDNYFDFKLDFKVEDIYELNNFFFEQ